MDNSRSLHGYKYYLDPATGLRPHLFVAFLNLVPADGNSVNGMVFRTDPDDLASLDQRERNYLRIDVTDRVTEQVPGRIWTYIGTPDAEERFRIGARERRVVISREYLEGVRHDFATLGQTALSEFDDSTEHLDCPLVDLERIDIE